MNTSKHTPGPWVIRNKDAVYAQSGRFIADCELTPYGSRPQPPNSTDEANAHLIAAAPAMYEALRRLHDVLDTRLPSGLAVNQVLPKELFDLFYGPAIEARQALAQAEGK